MRRLLAVPAILGGVAAMLVFAPAASAVDPGTYPAVFNDANGPSGAHVQRGTVACVVTSALDVNCNPYTLGGVGNTNADLNLTATWHATIDCFNPADHKNRNNPIESHQNTFDDSDTSTALPSRNGQLRVPAKSVSPGSVQQVCPNDNWVPRIRPNTLELVSFSYTLTFAGFGSPYITIQRP
jgi:hypothetical protein